MYTLYIYLNLQQASDAHSRHTTPPGQKSHPRLILCVASTRREVREDNREQLRHGEPSKTSKPPSSGFFSESPPGAAP
jgi:hypothetical protein